MDKRIKQELKLLKREFPDLKHLKDKNEIIWIYIPAYKLPPNIWNQSSVAVCFQIPVGYPGNPPYGFFVKVGLCLKGTNEKPSNYREPIETPFGNSWGKI